MNYWIPFRKSIDEEGLGQAVRIAIGISLVVTVLRLAGALGGLPDWLVNREAGGAGALIGIVWLVPVFAIWFGVLRARSGETGFRGALRTNFSYGVGARVPVIVVMLVATLGDWGTHYDAYPDMEHMAPLTKWFFGGVLAQVGFWILAVTTLGGGLVTWVTSRFAGKPIETGG